MLTDDELKHTARLIRRDIKRAVADDVLPHMPYGVRTRATRYARDILIYPGGYDAVDIPSPEVRATLVAIAQRYNRDDPHGFDLMIEGMMVPR